MKKLRAMVAGALGAGAGLVSAEAAAAVVPGSTSLVLGIADRVIASTPDSVRESLIGLFGTNDKALLSIGIVTTVLLGGALVGLLRLKRPSWTLPVIVAVAVAGVLLAAAGSPTSALLSAALFAVLAVSVMYAVLSTLLPAPTRSVGADASESKAQIEDARVAPQASVGSLDRRRFLLLSGAVGGAIVVGGAVIATVRRGALATVDNVRALTKLPVAQDVAPPLDAGTMLPVPGLPPVVTPATDFFLIDTALIKPTVDVADWKLSIGGRVSSPYAVTYADLMAMPQISRYVTLTCVSNEVGGELVGNALWQGVRLRDILDRAEVRPDGVMITSESVDGFTTAFPLAYLKDVDDAMVAVGMNGSPLPVNHGYPARLVIPGLYGYVSATKWLKEIRLTAVGDEVPFWIARGWLPEGEISLSSKFDVPRPDANVPAGVVMLAGRAWHQRIGIATVEVSVDQNPWQTADLADALGVEAWRLWSYRWQATPGAHSVRVRAIDVDGNVQSDERKPIFPGASSGLHTMQINVA